MVEQLGHYKILDRIGAGGLGGEVYRARDTRLGRTVAVKILPPTIAGDANRRERFMRDAHLATALSHPNIASLNEVGEDQGHIFLVYEFVPGEPLSAEIAGRPMNPSRAVALGVQLADALADAHGAGVKHTDLKPGNIIITPKGHAKILDFGLADWTSGGMARARAAVEGERTAVAAETVAYMSPEQILGGPLDERTDIFSLGCVLFEMLTGRPPFTGAAPGGILMQIVQSPSPAPSAVARGVPKEFDPIVAKTLTKALDGRYRMAAVLAADLRALEAVLDVRSERLEKEAETIRKSQPHGRGPWVLMAIILAIVAAAAFWLIRK